MSVLAGAGLASALSAIGTAVSNIALSERQRKWQEQMQDKQNLYNLPSEQLNRLRQAGISPNAAIMKDGSTVQGNTSAPVGNYELPNVTDPMSLIANNLLTVSQAKTDDEMRELRKSEIAAQIQTLQANAEKLGVDTQYQSILNTFAAARERAAIEGERSRTRLNFAQTRQVMQEARKLAFEVDKLLPEQVKQLINEQNLTVGQLDLLIAQIANINQDTTLKEKQGEVADSQAALNIEQRGLTAQESANYQEITDNLLAQYQATINKLVAETDLTEQEAFYYLYDICQKHSVRFMGIPLAGAGGIKDNLNQQKMQQNVREKYNLQ